MTPRIFGVHHIAITTHDLPRLAQFYGTLLGLPPSATHEDDLGLRSVWLTLGETIVMLERASLRAAAWTERFDLPRAEGFEPRKGMQATDLSSGVVTGEVTHPFARGALGTGHHLAAFRIAPEDRSAWRRRLANTPAGVTGETLYTLYGLDPDGNRIGFSSWPHVGQE